MSTTNLMELVVKSLPAKVWYGILDWIKTALGQMATGEFWIKLLETIVKQMTNAFLITLGGKLLTYGTSREDPEVKKITNTYTGHQAVNTASSAFNGNAVRAPDYVSQFSHRTEPRPAPYPVPVQQQQNPLEKTFPWYGGNK